MQIDPIRAAVVSDAEAVVNLALAIHPFAHLGLAHQGGKAVLQDSGADAGEHSRARVLLQHDGFDPLQAQEL